MAQGGTIKSRLEVAEKELQAELALWKERELDPAAWRMGQHELLIRCELLILLDIIKEKLEISQDELDLRLKERLIQQMQALRPMVFEQFEQFKQQEDQARLAKMREELTRDIFIKPDLEL